LGYLNQTSQKTFQGTPSQSYNALVVQQSKFRKRNKKRNKIGINKTVDDDRAGILTHAEDIESKPFLNEKSVDQPATELTQMSGKDPSKTNEETSGNILKGARKSDHSTLEDENPAKAYASPATPEDRRRDGQTMDVKFMAKDRKRSTPCQFIKSNNKKQTLAQIDTQNTH